MMAELTVVKKSQRGPCLTILFSFNSNNSNNGAVESEVFHIDELAMVKFSFVYSSKSHGTHYVSMTSMKHENNSAVKIKLVCNSLSYLNESICSDDWLNWRQIGCHRELQTQNPNYSYSCTQKTKDVISFTEIIIVVYECKKVGFEMLYGDSDFTDLTLEALDGSVRVHKACLAAHCVAFKNMLTGPWVEAEKGCIHLKDITKETLDDLKEFIYLGVLPETDRLPNLLVLASLYFLDDLKDKCIRKLVLTVLPEELNSLHTLACMYNIPQLSVAISLWTPEEVIDKAYEIEKKKRTSN